MDMAEENEAEVDLELKRDMEQMLKDDGLDDFTIEALLVAFTSEKWNRMAESCIGVGAITAPDPFNPLTFKFDFS